MFFFLINKIQTGFGFDFFEAEEEKKRKKKALAEFGYVYEKMTEKFFKKIK